MSDTLPTLPEAITWESIVEKESQKPYWKNLVDFIKEERSTYDVYPPKEHTLAAFSRCPYGDTKVVILGQDPYHGSGLANGLAFSVSRSKRIPPSLQNIHKELQGDLGITPPSHGDLSRWCGEGVLLLNTTLTVRSGEAGTHFGRGWETFTDEVIRCLNGHPKRLVFILWGKHAQSKIPLIDTNEGQHAIIKSAHPSPYSASNGFFGSKPFSRANALLTEWGRGSIDWSLV